MNKLLYNIKGLLQIDNANSTIRKGKSMQELPQIEDAWLLIKNGKIADYGEMKDFPDISNIKKENLQGKFVLPTWIDSHTHLVYAENRESEFVDRLKGKTYQ